MSNDYFFNQITWTRIEPRSGQEFYLSSLIVLKSVKTKEVRYSFFVVIPNDDNLSFIEYSSPVAIKEPTEDSVSKAKMSWIDTPKGHSLVSIVKIIVEQEKMVITGLYQGEEKVLLEAFNKRLQRDKTANTTRKDKKESNP